MQDISASDIHFHAHLRHDVLRERERDIGTVALRVAAGQDRHVLIGPALALHGAWPHKTAVLL